RRAGMGDDIEIEVVFEHDGRAEVEVDAAVERAERGVEEVCRALRTRRRLGQIADQHEQIGDVLLHVMLHEWTNYTEGGHYNSVRWVSRKRRRFHSSRWTYTANGCRCSPRIPMTRSSAAAVSSPSTSARGGRFGGWLRPTAASPAT